MGYRLGPKNVRPTIDGSCSRPDGEHNLKFPE
jgi:hypothetical protein